MLGHHGMIAAQGGGAYVGTKAGQTDGVDERLSCASPPAQPVTDFSVSFWIRQDASIGAQVYVQRYTSASVRWSFEQNGGNIRVFWGATGGSMNAQRPITLGAWTHVVATFSSASTRTLLIYTNGTASLPTTSATAAVAITGALSVGSAATLANYSAMTMCDIAIWNRVLSGADVTALYASGVRVDPRTATGGAAPIALYAFTATDDMTGTTGSIADLIGGNPLIPTNTESGDLVAGP